MKISGKIKFIFIAVVCVFAIFIALATVFMFATFKELNTSTDTFIYNSTYQKSRYVNQLISNRIDTVQNAAECFKDYHTADSNEIRSKLKGLTESSGFLNIIIIDENGDVISYREEKNVYTREYFRTAYQGKVCVSKSLYSSPDKTMANVFAAPIYGDYKRVVGVIAGICDTDTFADELNMAINGTEKNANGYIINSDGEVLLSGENVLGTSQAPIEDYFFTAPLFTGASHETMNKVKDDFKKKNVSAVIKTAIETPDSLDEYITYYTDLSVMDDLHYVVTFRADDIFSALNGYIEKNVYMYIFFCAIIVMLALFYFMIMKTNVKRLRLANAEISRIAYVDPLTGYNTWDKFEKEAERLLSYEYRKYTLVSFDVDKFKAINDMYGHDEGNRILKLIADVVERNLLDCETFSRINSDTFYLLMVYHDDQDTIDRIRRIIQAIEYEFTELLPVLSFGIYKINGKGLSVRKMGDNADIARRTVKYSEASTYAFFSDAMLEELREEKLIENEMQNALDSNEFAVYFQPKFTLPGIPRLMGAEALVRWIKNGEVIPPLKFIPLFEKNRFILKLDYYVMDQVCKKIKQWQRIGVNNLMVSVNMSRVHLSEADFVEKLYQICKDNDVSTSLIEIEITESVAYESLDVLVEVFRQLKEYGFHISIDDFGSGYSSLNMLKDLPVDVLKIDRIFLTESNNTRANQIIGHVIKLAQSLGMSTICEGIETDEQVELLRDLGCDMAQGYFFAKPMPCEQFEAQLEQTKK